jgi:hypothetical protein
MHHISKAYLPRHLTKFVKMDIEGSVEALVTFSDQVAPLLHHTAIRDWTMIAANIRE